MAILETKHFINGVEIVPQNFETIGFKIDYSQDYNLPELNTDSVVLVNEAKQLVLDHISTLGVFEGIPYDITFGGITLNYYIDLTDSPIIGDSQIEVKIKRRKSVLNFMDNAKGLSFEALNKTHPINLVNAGYVIVKDNQEVQLVLFSLNIYVMAKELADNINAVVESITDIVKASTPNAGVPPSMDLGDIIAAITLLAMRTAYGILIALKITEMVKEIIEILVPSVKTFKASKVIELLNKGCSKLGYTFESSLIDTNLTILPVPLSNTNPSVFEKYTATSNVAYTKGYPTALDSTPTLGSLIDFVKSFYNADLSVNGSIVSLEPYTQTPSTTISNTLNIQSKRENSYTFNTGESWKRYLVKYQFDTSDLHTLNNYQKGQAEYSTEPLNVVNADLVTIKGLVSVDIPFSFGIRKDGLNFVEKRLLSLAEFADEVLTTFGGSGGYASKIKGRKGNMQISQQQFGNSKLLYLNGSKQPKNYFDKIGAKAVFEYHQTNNVKENFKHIYTSSILLSSYQFNDIINGGNTVVDSETDEVLEIISIDWINENVTAEINYSVKGAEGFNTKILTIYE
jgi:hypothetical protein